MQTLMVFMFQELNVFYLWREIDKKSENFVVQAHSQAGKTNISH